MLTRGVTLVEMLVTLAAASLLLHGFYVWRTAALEEAVVQRTVDGILLVDEAAYAYHAERGDWPVAMRDLVAAGLLPPHPQQVGQTALANGTGGQFVLTPVSGGGIRIATELLEAGDPSAPRLAQSVVRAFPHGTAASGNTVELVRTTPPGAHSDLEVFVRRDATRAMTAGPLRFAGNGIAGVSEVAFQGEVVEGRPCRPRRIATASDGTLMQCLSGVWRAVGAAAGGMPCSWSGWMIVDLIGWSSPNVSPGYTAGSVMAWRCENGRVVEVARRRCSYRGSVAQGRGSPDFTLAQCGLS